MSNEALTFHRYQATPTEISELRRLSNSWHRSGEFWSYDYVLKVLEQKTSILYYLRKGGEEHGDWAAVALYQYVLDQADLIYVYVEPQHRGQKYGVLIMEKSTEYLRNIGVGVLTLEVKVSNIAAQKLYERLGFLEIDRRPRYYEGREDAIVMQKEL